MTQLEQAVVSDMCWKSSMPQLEQAIVSDLFCKSLTLQMEQAVLSPKTLSIKGWLSGMSSHHRKIHGSEGREFTELMSCL